jgi:hypothetical protein
MPSNYDDRDGAQPSWIYDVQAVALAGMGYKDAVGKVVIIVIVEVIQVHFNMCMLRIFTDGSVVPLLSLLSSIRG